MFIYYFLLFMSALIFSLQFLITRMYEKRKGTTFFSSVWLSLFAYFAVAVFFLVKGSISLRKFNFGFSSFTFLITLLVAVVSLCNVFMGIKVLDVGDLSVYSVFMMLGSLILPSVVGLIFYDESLTLLKGIALVCMIAAIVFSVSSVDKSKLTKKAFLYYIGIFVMNGMIGVLFTIHQNSPAWTALPIKEDGAFKINNDLFMMWNGLSTVILCSAVYLVRFVCKAVKKSEIAEAEAEEEKEEKKGGKALLVVLLLAFLYGICNGVGDYFIAIATQPGALGSSVTFPIINGGTILFSTLSGVVFYKEKLKPFTIVSVVLVIVSTVLFMFV